MPSNEGYKDPDDLITRGDYKPTPLGRAVFVGLRALDPLLQYSILSRHAAISWIPQRLGGALLPATGAAYLLRPANTGTFLDLPPYQSVILAMSVGAMLKQNFWVLAIGREQMQPGNAVIIAAFNTVINSLISALAMWTSTSINPPASTIPELLKSPYVTLGFLMYLTGILTETVSEIQRSNFKKDEQNKGKPYSKGLFGLARNINYGGYVLWRAGYAMVAAGPALAIVVGGFHFYDFAHRAIPVLDKYCTKKYGSDWENIKKTVPSVLFPGVY